MNMPDPDTAHANRADSRDVVTGPDVSPCGARDLKVPMFERRRHAIDGPFGAEHRRAGSCVKRAGAKSESRLQRESCRMSQPGRSVIDGGADPHRDTRIAALTSENDFFRKRRLRGH